MGLVINPTAFRMGLSKSWTDAWYMHRMNYPVFVHNTLTIKSLIFFILFRYFPGKFSKWIYSHVTFYIKFDKMFINLYIYDANSIALHKRLAKYNKYGWWRKVRFGRFWTKKYLLDQQFMYQRWALLLQTLNIRMENIQLDNLKYRLKRHQLRKIDYLKKNMAKVEFLRNHYMFENFLFFLHIEKVIIKWDLLFWIKSLNDI